MPCNFHPQNAHLVITQTSFGDPPGQATIFSLPGELHFNQTISSPILRKTAFLEALKGEICGKKSRNLRKKHTLQSSRPKRTGVCHPPPPTLLRSRGGSPGAGMDVEGTANCDNMSQFAVPDIRQTPVRFGLELRLQSKSSARSARHSVKRYRASFTPCVCFNRKFPDFPRV